MFAKFYALVKRIPEIAKAIVATVGGILTASAALSTELGITIIPADWVPWITWGLAILTGIATWRVPNAPKAEPAPIVYGKGHGLFK
jgi:hypothetical protein